MPLRILWTVLLLCASSAASFAQVSMSIAFHGEWASSRFPLLKSTLDCSGKIKGSDKNGDGMLLFSATDANANEASLFQLTCSFNDRDARGGWQAGCGPLSATFKSGSFKVKTAPGAYTQGSAELTISNLTWHASASSRTCQFRVSDQFGPLLNVDDPDGNNDIPYYRGARVWTFVAN